MKRLTLTLFSVLLIASLFLTACAPKAPENVTIKVMSFFAYDNPEVEQAVVAAFRESHPTINVDFQLVTMSNIFTKYKTLIAGNASPDVMAMNYDNAYQFGALGALEDLGQWITKTNLDTSIYYQPTLDMFKVNGTQYSMPATFSDVVLFFNKNMFDAAGVEYPQRDWTWSDLKQAASKLTQDTNNDGKIDQWGYSFPWWPLTLEMYDAKFWNADATACTLNTPEGIKALQSIVDGRYTEKFAPTSDALAEQGEWDMFMAGKLAMYPTGPWAVQPFNDGITSFTYDIAHMPAGDQQATHVYANAYSMSATSKNKEAAWEFISFATGPEGTKIRQEGKYEISPVKDIAEKYYVEALKGANPEHAIVFMEVQDYAVPQPVHANWQQIYDSVAPEVDLALNNSKSVQDALNAACAAADKVLGK
jgi:multiple sugar transport system substrate-binding protein